MSATQPSEAPPADNLFLIHATRAGETVSIQAVQPGASGASSVLINFGQNSPVSEHFVQEQRSSGRLPFHSSFFTRLAGGDLPLITGLYNPELPGAPPHDTALLMTLRRTGNYSPAQLETIKNRLEQHAQLNETHEGVVLTSHEPAAANNIPYLKPQIPLVAKATNIKMLGVREAGAASHDQEFTYVTDRSQPQEDGNFPKQERPATDLKDSKSNALGAFQGALLHATSGPLGATAVTLTYPNGVRLHHTGNLGPGESTQEYLQTVAGSKPDILFFDAAGLTEENQGLTEMELPERIAQIAEMDSRSNQLVYMAPDRLKRLAAIVEATRESKKPIYIPLEMAAILNEMQDQRRQEPHIPTINEFSIYATPEQIEQAYKGELPKHLTQLMLDSSGTLKGTVYSMSELAHEISFSDAVTVINQASQIDQLAAAERIGTRKLKNEPARGRGTSTQNQFIYIGDNVSAREYQILQNALSRAHFNPDDQFRLPVRTHLNRLELAKALKMLQPRLAIPLQATLLQNANTLIRKAVPKTNYLEEIDPSAFYKFDPAAGMASKII